MKIVFAGEKGVGKTQLVNLLSSYPRSFSPVYRPTTGTHRSWMKAPDGERKFSLWDTAGKKKYGSSFLSHHYRDTKIDHRIDRHVEILVYCIDLSQEINKEKIKKHLRIFRKHCKEGQIILVGTKSDIDTSGDYQEKLEGMGDDISARILTSSKNKIGIEALRQSIANVTMSKLIEAKELLVPRSSLWEALNDLHQAVSAENLPQAKYAVIAAEALDLVKSLQGKSDSKEKAIEKFLDNCAKELNGKHPYVMKTVLAVAVTAVVTVIVGLLAFSIGFLAGAWTGPGAFISGLVTGSSGAAVTAVTVSGTLGLTAGTFAFFKESAATKAVKAVAVEAENFPIMVT